MKNTKMKLAAAFILTIVLTALVTGAVVKSVIFAHLERVEKSPFANETLRMSPFTMVRYDGDKVIVNYNGSDYELAAIDGLTTAQMLNFCRVSYGQNWQQKRFAEDLVVVLQDMGQHLNVDHTVSLELIDPKTGENKSIDKAVMTKANRELISNSLAMNARAAK